MPFGDDGQLHTLAFDHRDRAAQTREPAARQIAPHYLRLRGIDERQEVH